MKAKVLLIVVALLIPVTLTAQTNISIGKAGGADPGYRTWVSGGGNVSKVVTVTPTLDTSAYAAGDCLHAEAVELEGVGSSGIVESIVILDKSGQGKNLDVVVFNTEPSTICAAVNGAFDPADADLLLVAGTSKITQHAVYNDNGASENSVTKIPFKAASGTSAWIALVAREAVTYAASDLSVKIAISN